MKKETILRTITFAFLALLAISASAQINAEIIRPSVNADQFSIAVKAETALSKGQLSLNIPLMELKGKGYDLPISLTFYNGDVTFSTEASPIGLGWALMAGGVITKTIRGADDTAPLGSIEHHNDSNYILNRYNDQYFPNDILLDPLPDEYTYSLPGHSGTIEVSVDGNTTCMSLYPDESYKMESIGNGYCITADDGTKYYFEDFESRTISDSNCSTSWFLTRIVTTKDGVITFNYADEEYVDLSTGEYELYFEKYCTKRITSIVSDFGSVTFHAVTRSDRGSIGNRFITVGKESKRINKIELRDENNSFVKGYELDNSGLFELYREIYEYTGQEWCNYRHKLSSITQYDTADNRLPPYSFIYEYKFSKSKLAELISYTNPQGDYMPRDSWTSCIVAQAYVDLDGGGNPLCYINPDMPNGSAEGIITKWEDYAITADDYFCLASIHYPTGAIDEFTYESHRYNKVNNTHKPYSYYDEIQGRRLSKKVRHGSGISQRTDYVYMLHDANYNIVGPSSGVLTNPSIHCATYYTPGTDARGNFMLRASRLTSGKALNSFMGPPVCYTEVEEVEKDEFGDTLNRTIHYFEPQIVSPPVNYIFMNSVNPWLLRLDNKIYGTKSGYTFPMEASNYINYTYMAYPVGDFYNVAFIVDKPLKEVFIGRDGDVRSIKEYLYYLSNGTADKKYGYKIVNQNNGTYLISKSEYITRRVRLRGISTTSYYYSGNSCDSIYEEYRVSYNKGRVSSTFISRSNDSKTIYYYYPSDIINIVGNNSSPTIESMSKLVEKNIVADPIKTVQKRNSIITGGECKDYQMLSGKPLLKSLYKLKNTGNNSTLEPTISGNDIDYHADLYKEGEILTFDEYKNPEHVKLNNTQNRIYVWGYEGRFPIAVIDNMDGATFQASTNLKSQILQLATYRKIETEDGSTSLRNLNAAIRSLLPGSAHITTYTYDPYFGMTSETDNSNLGAIYTYDSFGRLTAKYDVNYKKLEDYNYHYQQQQ